MDGAGARVAGIGEAGWGPALVVFIVFFLFKGLGFRGLGFRGFRGLGVEGLGFRV